MSRGSAGSLQETSDRVQLYYQKQGRIKVAAPSGANYRVRNGIVTVYRGDLDYILSLVDDGGRPMFGYSPKAAVAKPAVLVSIPMIDALRGSGSRDDLVAKAVVASTPAPEDPVVPEEEEPSEPFDFTVLSGIGNAKNRALYGAGIETAAAFLATSAVDLSLLLGSPESTVAQWKEELGNVAQ